jgi:CheY-like chemotaxis protein
MSAATPIDRSPLSSQALLWQRGCRVAGEERAVAPKQMVLIVDDNPDIRESLGLLLETEGYAVAEAGNGVEALARLDDGPIPCLIVLDLMMPEMDGFSFLEALDRRAPRADVPVVVVSGHPELRRRVSSPAVAAFLQKPVEYDVLLDVVERHCGGRS